MQVVSSRGNTEATAVVSVVILTSYIIPRQGVSVVLAHDVTGYYHVNVKKGEGADEIIN